MNKIGEKILNARKEKGLTQKELANLLNVNTKDISNWERGLEKPDEKVFSKLAAVLNIENPYKKVEANTPDDDAKNVAYIVCVAVGLAMGVAITTLNAMEEINARVALSMFGIGLFAVSLALLLKNNE